MLLGAVVRDFGDPFFAGAIEALAVESARRGYNVVLGHGRLDEAWSLPAVLETRHCDAIVLLGDMQDQPRLLEDLGHSIVPVVALWQGSSPLLFPTVDVDNEAGIRVGLEHLVGLGHERIAMVSAQLPGDNPQRRDAFIAFMVERFGSVRPDYIQDVPNTMAGGEAALDALLELDDPPTALVTSTDLVAIGVLHAAYSRGRIVPRELSVVGFDDIPIAAHTAPALTTLRMPITEMVREGVRLAVGFAAGPDRAARGAHPVVRSDARRPRIHGPARDLRPDADDGAGRLGLTPRVSRRVGRRRHGDPDPHGLDGPVGPREVGDRADLDRGARRGERAAIGQPDRRAREVVAGRLGRPDVGIDADVLELDAGRQVRRLDAVHERPALERDAPADGVDPRMRPRHARRHVEGQHDHGRRRSRTASAPTVRAPAGTVSRPAPPISTLADSHQPGIRSDSVHGVAGVSRIVTATSPLHG